MPDIGYRNYMDRVFEWWFRIEFRESPAGSTRTGPYHKDRYDSIMIQPEIKDKVQPIK